MKLNEYLEAITSAQDVSEVLELQALAESDPALTPGAINKIVSAAGRRRRDWRSGKKGPL
jgi:hypothetical protein